MKNDFLQKMKSPSMIFLLHSSLKCQSFPIHLIQTLSNPSRCYCLTILCTMHHNSCQNTAIYVSSCPTQVKINKITKSANDFSVTLPSSALATLQKSSIPCGLLREGKKQKKQIINYE